MRPARAALTRPARGASFRLIVTVSHVSMGGHNYRTVREDISIDHQHRASRELPLRAPGGSIQRRMPFAYFKRLSRRQQAIYLESDGIATMPPAAAPPAQ